MMTATVISFNTAVPKRLKLVVSGFCFVFNLKVRGLFASVLY